MAHVGQVVAMKARPESTAKVLWLGTENKEPMALIRWAETGKLHLITQEMLGMLLRPVPRSSEARPK